MKRTNLQRISIWMVFVLILTLWSPIGSNKVQAEEEKSEFQIVLTQDEEELEQIPQLPCATQNAFQCIPQLKKGSQIYEDVDFTFSSSNEDFAEVNEEGWISTGIITQQQQIQVLISCENPEVENDYVEATFDVTITPVSVERVEADVESKTLVIGEPYNITAQAFPENAIQEFLYSTSDESVATVSVDGVVTGLSQGYATITVASKQNEEVTDTVRIQVIDIPVALELESQNYSIKATDQIQIQAVLRYASGKKVSVSAQELKFSSLHPTVVAVNAQGLVTALEQSVYPQSGIVLVEYQGSYELDGEQQSIHLEAKCNINVTAIPVESLTLGNPESAITMEIKDTYVLMPKIMPENATIQAVKYSSSDTSVATVGSAGKITAKSIGETVITVSAVDNPEIKVTFKVQVFQTQFDAVKLGAIGTDTKTDDAVLNKILAYADHELMKNQVITVNVPNGTYYIDAILTIHSNTNLVLQPKAIIKRKTSAGGKVMLRSHINGKGGYEQCKNITITGGVWDGNADGSKDANCIYIGHAQNVVISDTTVKNCSGAHLIELAGVKNAIIENVDLYGYKICKEKGYDGVQAEKEAIQLDYCSSSSTPAMKPHDLTPCENVTIRKCTIQDYMSGIGCHGAWQDVYLKNISIQDNTFNEITNACISMYHFKNATVKNNKASGFTTFLYASGCDGTISGNTMKNKSFQKLTTSYLQAANGITVSNGSKFTISKNTIEKATSNGITVWNGSTATINNNKIKSNKLYGIRTQGSKITLKKNTFSKNKKGLYDTYKDATVKSSDDIRAYYVNIKKKYTYTGSKIKPKIKLKNLNKKYYKVTYKKNKKVGTATVIIKGKGKVKGTLMKTFKIVRK